MARNPYLAAYRLRRRHRLQTVGGWVGLAQAAVPLLVALLLVPFVEPVFLGFLYLPASDWGGGFEAVGDRAGLLLVAVTALDVFSALIRSPDRAVLDLHPVDPGAVVVFEVVRVIRERAWLPIGLLLVLLPVARVAPGAWLLLAGLVFGCWALGLAASTLTHLAAVEVAESETFAPLLDLVRGHNPRSQAAFIYAPGAVLAAAAGAVLAAGWGLRTGWQGQPAAYALLVVPYLAAAVSWWPVRRLAGRAWFRASAVLADIDARYAALEGRGEEARRVYLDWVVRFLPVDLGRYVLKDLRHGWRGRRAWITGPWLGGLVGLAASWSAAHSAPAAAAGIAVACVWLFAAIGAVLDRDDPPFLVHWMPAPPRARAAARWIVLAAWGQGAVWLPFLGVWLRHGIGPALGLFGTVCLSVAVAVPVAWACGRSRAWGPWLYGPVAALAVAATAAWTVGGPT